MELEKLKYEMMSSQLQSEIKLSKKQNNAFSRMIKGENVFITGVAGSGKTECIKLFIKIYKSEKKIGITSTTGISALLFGGVTLHAFLGIGLGTESVDDLTSKIYKRPHLRKRWNELEILIIDEISMLSPDLLDKIEEIARRIRYDERPFGGIQLVLSGDFCFSGDTSILMYNGTLKLAKDIKIGDSIMGDDQSCRKVLNLFRGTAPMYKISFPEDESIIVTGNHTLCLKHIPEQQIDWDEIYKCWVVYYWNNNMITKLFYVNNQDKKDDVYNQALSFRESLPIDNIIEVTVNNFINLPKNIQKQLECYKVIIDRWPHKKEYDLLISPWSLGVWLGSDNNVIDLEGIDEEKYKFDKLVSKNIPDEYMYSSKKDRLELLAGFIDINSILYKNTVIIYQNILLGNQICFLARSVGLTCNLKYIEENNDKICRCLITGSIYEIPCRSQNKKIYQDKKYKRVPMNITITQQKEDNFYGFETDSNKRFLLEDFIVTHNCQLPCVKSKDFCFESKAWDKCIPKNNVIYLDENMRQENQEFQDCLNNIRIGYIPQKTRKLLETRIKAVLKNDFGIKPTKLFSTNYSVDVINNEELDKLAESGLEFFEYNMETIVYPGVKDKQYVIEKYKKNCNAPESLHLCKGAQVMLLYNMDITEGLVNGSRGVVVDFIGDLPIIKFLNGKEIIIDYHIWEVEEQAKKVLKSIQIPLKLAYACTIHKMQGSTLDYVEVDLSNLFEFGMAYVALSRTKNLEGLSINGIDFDKITSHPKALEFYSKLNKNI